MSSIPRTLGRARPASPLSRVSRATATIALALLAAVAGACTTPPPLRPEQRAAVRIEEAEAALIFEGPDVAQAGFDEALAWSPGDPRAIHGLWKVALARGDIEDALARLERLEADEPRYFEENARREHCGTLARAVGYFLGVASSRRALEVAARLERSDCGHPEAGALRASALMAEASRVGAGPNALRAVSFYQEAVEADPSRVDAFLGAGEALFEAGRFDEALSLLSDALARHPMDQSLQGLMLRVLSTPRPQ